MSDTKASAEHCRRQADLCLEVAKRMSLHEDRERMTAMARQWL